MQPLPCSPPSPAVTLRRPREGTVQCAGAHPSRPVGHPSRPDSRADFPKWHWGHKVLPHLRASSLALPLLPRFCPLTAVAHQAELSCLQAADAPGCPRQWSGPDKTTLAALRPAPLSSGSSSELRLGGVAASLLHPRTRTVGNQERRESPPLGLPPAPHRSARTQLRLPPRPTRASTRPCASGEASGVGFSGTYPKACSSGSVPPPTPPCSPPAATVR